VDKNDLNKVATEIILKVANNYAKEFKTIYLRELFAADLPL
jgi:hypothetical protein